MRINRSKRNLIKMTIMYLLEIKGIISKIILLKYGADKYMRKKSQKRDISEIINTLII